METFGIVICSDHEHAGFQKVACVLCDRPCWTQGSNYLDARDIFSEKVNIENLKKKYVCQPCVVNFVFMGIGYLASLPKRAETNQFLNSVTEMINKHAKKKGEA